MTRVVLDIETQFFGNEAPKRENGVLGVGLTGGVGFEPTVSSSEGWRLIRARLPAP